MIKYLVLPGHITSRTDGDRNFISGAQLIKLYNVDSQECIIVNGPDDWIKLVDLDQSKLIRLYPRNDGDYTK